MFRLITLGRIELTDAGGRPVEAILKRPKRLALLTYLALAGEGSLRSRDTVLGLFWPEHGQARARQSLNQALYVLRRALGKDVVVSVGNDQIGLAPGVLWCDAVALRAAVASGDQRSAQSHYRGDFLPGFFLSGTPEFEKWLDGERATLRRLASSSAWKLASEAAAAGDVESAADAAVRSAELSLREESAVRRAIELLDGLGERARALDLYRELEVELAEDLETTPSPETQAVVAQMRSRQPTDDVARAAAAGEASTASGAAQPARREWRYSPSAGPTADAGAGARRRTRRLRRGALLGVSVALVALLISWPPARIPATAAADAAAGSPPRLLVEPFDAYAADDRLTDIAGAITAGLAARLAEVDALDVLLVAAGATPEADSAALALGAAEDGRAWFIVRGRVLRDGDRMRAVVSLIDRPSGQVIGSATIERVTSDPLAFVDVATLDAARFTRAAVGRELRERAWRASTRNRQAWLLLERAEADRREAKELRGRGATDAARTALVQSDSLLALVEQREPGWLAPIVLRAQVARDRMWVAFLPPAPDRESALRFLGEGVAHADRALAIDSSDARARELKGVLLHWRAMLQPMPAESALSVQRLAEEQLRAAVAADPKRAEAWSTLSATLFHSGQHGEAYYAAQQAYAADAYLDQPEDILVKLFNGSFESRDDEAARRWCMELRERYAGRPSAAQCALTLLAWVEAPDPARVEEALAIVSNPRLAPEHPLGALLDMHYANVLARAGAADSAEAVLRRVRAGGAWSPELIPLEASLRLALGQIDSASALLRDYVDEKPATRRGVLSSRRFAEMRE